MLDAIRTRWRALRHELSGRLGGPRIDALLAAADHRQAFEARLVWLADVVHWVSTAGGGATGRDPTRPAQLTRLLHLLNLLDRNPEWKRRFALSVRSLVRELDALDVYCESGLPREAALLSEAAERLLVRLLPRNPYRTDLGSVLAALFPRAEDALWLEQIDAATLERVGRVVADGETPEERGWNVLWDDVPEALLLLIGELRVLGLSAPIRRRLGSASFRESPFFGLTGAAEAALAALASRDEAAAAAVERLRELLRRCVLTTDEVHAHLDEFGVSVKVVYLLERIRSLVRRIEDLLELLVRPEPAADGSVRFLARLVRDSRARTELRGLVSQNLGLLAKKVVDRAAETGEHYIARTREEYREILRAAAGGGLLMAGTTYVKLGIVGLHASPFVSGLLASLNYALSFVAIQLAHFTLATKQPAMTAPALAAKMDQVDTPEGLERLVDEVVHLLRSQMASIIGNLLLVPPAAILLAGIALLAGAGPPMDPEKARHTLESMSILGPSALYAAFTGVLLWLSSLASGWADNWFALRRIHEGLAHDRRLRGLFGCRRSEALAAYAQHHVSGIAGNVSLGFLLGMIPALGAFVGLPLDIRHVTLATGYVSAAAFSLGPRVGLDTAFWSAVLGLAAIGFLNVAVSFGLALALALRARDVRAPERDALRRALWRRLREQPLSFAYPTEATPVEAPGPGGTAR